MEFGGKCDSGELGDIVGRKPPLTSLELRALYAPSGFECFLAFCSLLATEIVLLIPVHPCLIGWNGCKFIKLNRNIIFLLCLLGML